MKKKLSLGIRLERHQLREILGGSVPVDDGGANCKIGSCSVYDSTTGTTYTGTCGVYVHSGTHPGSSPSTHCYCSTSLGHYVSTNNYAACTA